MNARRAPINVSKSISSAKLDLRHGRREREKHQGQG
jgi:hypothetical protein